MLAFLQTIVSFAALCVLCVFVARRFAMNSALAPLPVLAGAMILLVLSGYLGFLRVGVWLIFAFAMAAIAQMIATYKQGGFKRVLTPGFAFFIVASLVLITVFAIRQPVPQEWDEFSLWATAAKLTKMNGTIFTQAPIGWFYVGSQKPGLPTFTYLLGFFGDYAAWRVYVAYGILIFAVGAALMGALTWRHWKQAVPIAICAFLAPYFNVYLRDIYMNTAYLSLYADMIMGLVMGGALAWFYHARRTGAHVWPAALLTGAIMLCKDTGLPLALVAAGIMCVDLLFVKYAPMPIAQIIPIASGKSAPAKFNFKPLLLKIGACGAFFAVPAGLFVASSKYLGSLGSDQSTVGGSANFSPVTLVIEGFKMLLGLTPSAAAAPFSEKFSIIKNEMISLFLPGENHQVTMIGCGLYVMLAVLFILALTALCTRDKSLRRSTILYGVLSTLGFFAYYIFIGFTYVFVFKGEGTASILDYNRYITTYYIAWLLGALALLCLGAIAGSKWFDVLTGTLLAISIAWLFRFSQLVQPQLSVIDYPDVVYTEFRDLSKKVEDNLAFLPKNARLYFIDQNDAQGLLWFRNSYEVIPRVLTYSHGGGSFATPQIGGANNLLSADEWAAELITSESAYVYLSYADDAFWQSYGALFADGGAAYKAGKTSVYAVSTLKTPALTPLQMSDITNPETELDAEGKIKLNGDGTPRKKIVDAAKSLTLLPVVSEVKV